MDNIRRVLKLVIIGIVVIGTLTGCTYRDFNTPAPRAANGILDLTEWKLGGDLVPLDGQWEFYWNQLLDPKDFNNAYGKESTFINLPRAWNGYQVDNKVLSGDGYATYRLIIKTENNNKALGMRVPRILTSYKMWINEEPIASAGTVSKEKNEMIPQYLPQVVIFEPEGDQIEVVIQVANYKHRSGGILESLRLGEAAQVLDFRYKDIAYELFLFGSLLIMGLYHLALFVFRKKDLSPLYFGVFCIFVAARTLLVGQIFFCYLFPNFSWEITHKVKTLSFYLGVHIFVMFFKSLFPEIISNKALKISQGVGVTFGLLVLFTPVRIFTRFNGIFQIFALGIIAYMIYVIVKILWKNEIGGKLIAVGALVLIITSINDIIFLSTWMSDHDHHLPRAIIQKENLTAFGQLIFVLTHSLALGKKFSNSLVKEEEIASYQKELNENLEQLIKDRTRELEISNNKIQQKSSELQEANRVLQLLSLKDPLTNIWNRRHFDESLDLQWRRGTRLEKKISLIFIDIDYFKTYNDCYGHPAGDVCLKQVAKVLEQSCKRAGDLVARYGGEEFVVIMSNTEEDKALATAEAIRASVEKLRIPHKDSLISEYVTISLGVATIIPSIESSPKDLIKTADKAVYEAKTEGRNRVIMASMALM
ncbi:MAG: diguanylate cyclase [Clostridiaceae bacterium]|nr:diguanylate cyclase [Clostridiaceae bacterium]